METAAPAFLIEPPEAADCPACEAMRAPRERMPAIVAELRAGVVVLDEGHVLLVAKRHVAELIDLPEDEREAWLGDLSLLMRAVRHALAPLRTACASTLDDHLTWRLTPRHAPGSQAVTDPGELRRRILRGLLAAAPVRRDPTLRR